MKYKTLKKDCKWDFSKDQPTTTETKRPPRKAKPVQTVPNLDIMALSERISHLEEVVGNLIHVVLNTPQGGLSSKRYLDQTKLNPKTKALV